MIINILDLTVTVTLALVIFQVHKFQYIPNTLYESTPFKKMTPNYWQNGFKIYH